MEHGKHKMKDGHMMSDKEMKKMMGKKMQKTQKKPRKMMSEGGYVIGK